MTLPIATDDIAEALAKIASSLRTPVLVLALRKRQPRCL